MSLIPRVVRAGLAAAVIVALTGFALERVRLGATDQTAMARAHDQLQLRFDRGADTLQQVSARLEAQSRLVRVTPRDTAGTRALFDAVSEALPPEEVARTGVTVYDGAGTPLAWAGRVSDLPRALLDGPSAVVVAFGPPGPRLLRIVRLETSGRPGTRTAEIVVEQYVGEIEQSAGITPSFIVPTSVVPVTLRPPGSGNAGEGYTFAIVSTDGVRLANAVVSPTALAERRARWRRATWAATIGVLAVTLLLSAGPLVERRRRARRRATYAAISVGIAAVVLLVRVLLSAAAGLLLTDDRQLAAMDLLVAGLTLAAIVWLALDVIERRRFARPRARLLRRDTPSAILLVVGVMGAIGVADACLLAQYERLLHHVVSGDTVDLLHFSHYPVNPTRLAVAFGLVLLHAVAIWGAAAFARAPRLIWRTARPLTAISRSAWALGAGAAVAWLSGTGRAIVPPVPLIVALTAAAACAASLDWVRGRARRVSQAARLGAVFVALAAPSVAMYPSLVSLSAADKERVVAGTYAPLAVSQRTDLQDRVRQALVQVDALPSLERQLTASDGTGTASERAFGVWSATDLGRYRLTSAVELYGADGRLASRFALNLPEGAPGRYRAGGCAWDVYDEESPFGSSSRHVLRASRGICERGRVLGSIVVRAMLDYRTLPFIASQSPYLESLRPGGSTQEDAGHDIEFVVYGWSRAPVFSSGTSVWSLPDDVFQRLVESRAPFWATIVRDGAPYRVYVVGDQGGIYALGYAVTTWFGHLINLVEIITLTLGLYVLLLAGATLLNTLTSRTPASGRALLREVRSSFYRKLFLYFVLGAVVPVVVLALAIRTYFAAQLRAGIDESAAKTATVAERLVEDYATLQPGTSGALGAIDDQIMVLVGQAIDQDVNLFARGKLQATSERDLFETGLLSTRTPADVYRKILLDRLPTFVGEESVAGYPYRLAAAPVRSGGREGIVAVPLTLRQQEIEQQIHELDHRIVFAAVLFSMLGAALGYWMAERIADPVNRLTRATRRIARGDLDARIAATSSDELRRLVEDFNQMAADLKRQRTELERTQRLEAWAEMARQVAHDIKNPLTPIQLSAEHARRVNIDRGRPLSPVLDECVNAILTQVKLLRQISSEFSNFASSPTARPEPTSLPVLLEEMVAPYRMGLAGRVDVRLDAPDNLPLVTIDPTLFARALTNVFENALHAMPGSGTLAITIRLKPDTSAIAIEISDTGVGMDPPALARIFEPYFSTKATGTGLGLVIAKRNVELNGGTIEVRSARGAGTTVRITVPV